MFQDELRRAYVRGGPGAIVSGLIWLAAALVSSNGGVATGFAVLFFGGMLIFPISKLVVQFLFRRPSESKGNPGGLIVMETVFPMIGGLFAAWLLLPHRPEFVFPLSAIAVGAHYFGFRTAYGDWTYWAFGAILCFVGVGSIVFGLPSSAVVPYLVAMVEIAFGIGFICFDRAGPVEYEAGPVERDAGQ
ncbi:MAG: hypothetical protein AAFX06_12490 [Planctomycetota bacterium]